MSTKASFDTSLARIIDHTLLTPEAQKEQIAQLCDEARAYGFAAVCVNPSYVRMCSSRLRGSTVKVCTVIGFPLGATSSAAKAYEAAQAIDEGAQELDMVINIGMLKSGDDSFVLKDMRSVATAAKQGGALLKVILETSLLTDEEKRKVCEFAKAVGADFVKTSTGFADGGATVADIQLMRSVVGPSMGVKASGGIRTSRQARSMILAGATRIGCSLSVQIVTEQNGPTDVGY